MFSVYFWDIVQSKAEMKRAVVSFYSTFLLAAVTAARLPKSGGHHRQATYYSVIKRAFVITDRVVGVLATKLLPSKPHQQLCTSQSAIPFRFVIKAQMRCVKTGRGIVASERQYREKNLQKHGRGKCDCCRRRNLCFGRVNGHQRAFQRASAC